MSNYNCLTMMILRKCRANYEELTSLINMNIENDFDDRKELVPAFGYWTGRLPVAQR